MARLHTRRHGKSKSRKPLESEMKVDVERGKVEEAIVGYAKQGMKAANMVPVAKKVFFGRLCGQPEPSFVALRQPAEPMKILP